MKTKKIEKPKPIVKIQYCECCGSKNIYQQGYCYTCKNCGVKTCIV